MGYPQQPPPPPPAYGYPQQQQWGTASGVVAGGTGETAGWDPNSYYGAMGDAGGAGGFNWWENSGDE
jgi:hypothetical protein